MMITYQDTTFCAHSGVCANSKCNRWVDFDKAKDSGMPVALSDFKTDDCGYNPNPILEDLVKAEKGKQG